MTIEPPPAASDDVAAASPCDIADEFVVSVRSVERDRRKARAFFFEQLR